MFDPIKRLSREIKEPSLFGKREPADRPRRFLNQYDIALTHFSERRTADPAEARFHGLTAVEYQRQERFGKNCEVYTHAADRLRCATEIAQPEAVAGNTLQEFVDLDVHVSLQ